MRTGIHFPTGVESQLGFTRLERCTSDRQRSWSESVRISSFKRDEADDYSARKRSRRHRRGYVCTGTKKGLYSVSYPSFQHLLFLWLPCPGISLLSKLTCHPTKSTLRLVPSLCWIRSALVSLISSLTTSLRSRPPGLRFPLRNK